MNRSVIYGWLPLFLLSCLCFYLQTKMFLNLDVNYLSYGTKIFLHGGSYTHNFFETNPPMILYWYIPAVWLESLLHTNVIYTMPVYVILLCWGSLIASNYFLKQIFVNDVVTRVVFLYFMAFVLLLLPAGSFAQREHLLMIVSLPYFFCAVMRAQNLKVNPYVAFCIGLFAGLAFGLKPFFLPTLMLVELYVLFKVRSLWKWIRIENIVIASVFVIYLISIKLFQPDYFNVVLPLVMDRYFNGAAQGWGKVIFVKIFLFCLIPAFAYLFIRKHDRYPDLGFVLFFALIGFIVAYLIPDSAWYYHMLPAIGVAWLLMGSLFAQAIASSMRQQLSGKLLLRDISFVVMIAGVVFAYPITLLNSLYHYSINLRRDASFPEIMQVIQSHDRQEKIACFSSVSGMCVLLQNYYHAKIADVRFQSFWWLPGVVRDSKDPLINMTPKFIQDRNYIVGSVAEDLMREKPTAVVLDMDFIKRYMNGSFDYIQYFSQNAQFKHVWKDYKYLKTVGNYQIYIKNT